MNTATASVANARQRSSGPYLTEGLACIMQAKLQIALASCKSDILRSVLQRSYPEQVCSIARALEVVGERWSLLILRDARLGVRHFDAFQASLGIASNVLASRLKLLCDERVLERRPDPERPGRPEYVLTDKGHALGPALITLMKWGDRYYPTAAGPPRLTVHAGCGGQVDDTQRCDRCEERVEFGDLDILPGPGLARA
jgi:DNA-binding HxlR family transcriptional regulator